MKKASRNELPISEIKTDSALQPREQLNFATYTQYKEDLEEGVVFPPIKVKFDGENYWLWDGYHRLKAAELAGVDVFPVEITEGSFRDAQLASFGANSDHGLARTKKDKRRVVKAMLEDEEWSKWVDNEIARRCDVSQPFVSKLRKIHTYNVISMKKFIHPKTGQPTTMDTANIGKPQPEDDDEAQPDLFSQAEQKQEPEPRRSMADKSKEVMALLEDEEWSQWADNEIARKCKVSPQFVRKLRASLEGPADPDPPAKPKNYEKPASQKKKIVVAPDPEKIALMLKERLTPAQITKLIQLLQEEREDTP